MPSKHNDDDNDDLFAIKKKIATEMGWWNAHLHHRFCRVLTVHFIIK
jgi:hypothetical protein